MQDFLLRHLQIAFSSLIIMSFFPNGAMAQSPPASGNSKAPVAKKGFNTQIYEKEDSSTFSDQVRLTREMAGEFQVFFKNHTGVYRLSESSSGQALLVRAQKRRFPVQVTVEPESRMILKVEEKE